MIQDFQQTEPPKIPMRHPKYMLNPMYNELMDVMFSYGKIKLVEWDEKVDKFIEKYNPKEKEKPMLDTLLALVKNAQGTAQPLLHVANIMATVENLAKMVSTEVLKDGSTKNAAIDIVCNMLQAHKDVVPVAQPVTNLQV